MWSSKCMKLHDNQDIEALDHPVTLKLFLYAKAIYPKDFGVREAKRKLDFNSPSTVLWHLDKLVEANLIEKLPTNRYKLFQSGLEIKEINVPVKYTAQIIRGELVPRRIFLISFVITAFLITLVFTILNPLVASILGSVLLGINAVLYILNYLAIKRQLSYYSWWKEKDDNNK